MSEKGMEPVSLAFINMMLTSHKKETIEDITIIENKTLNPEFKGQKKFTVDFRGITNEGVNILMELQQEDANMFKNRSYLSQIIVLSRSVKAGKLDELKPCLLFNIVDFKICKKIPGPHNRKFNMSDSTECEYTELSQIYNLDLVLLRKMKKFNLNNPEHQWGIFFLKNKYPKEFKKVIKMNQAIKMAHKKAIEVLNDENAIISYELAELKKQEYDYELKYREEKGRKEGIEKEKIDNARKMKEDNLTYEKISQYTGLSVEQIETL
jgi:predicted transposase/invertase (TIGR01784 family)